MTVETASGDTVEAKGLTVTVRLGEENVRQIQGESKRFADALLAKNDSLAKLSADMYAYVTHREMELCNACTSACDGDCGACGEYDGACGLAKRRFEELFAERMLELKVDVSS